MQRDFGQLVKAAAPRPSGAVEVDAMWERGKRGRVARKFVVASSVTAVALFAWVAVQGGSISKLLQVDRGGPAGPASDSPSSAQTTPPQPEGTLYLENLCHNVGDCDLTVVGLDARTSHTVAVPELALGDAQFRIVRTGSRLVFRGSTGNSTGSDVATLALDLDLERDPDNIGESWYFVPSAAEGRVWLAILDPESPATVRALKAVKEVTVEGEVTVPRTALPPGRWSSVAGAVEGALVFQGDDGLEVWDPFKEELVLSLPGPFLADTQGPLIAWCEQGCEAMHITNVASGEDQVFTPEGFAFEETYYGAFSPDGSLLALPAVTEDRRRVALIDVESGTTRVIEGSALDASYGSITWSSSGDWVFFNAGGGRIMTYRLGSEEAKIPSGRARQRGIRARGKLDVSPYLPPRRRALVQATVLG